MAARAFITSTFVPGRAATLGAGTDPIRTGCSGRRWWAHLVFTRINVALTTLAQIFEEIMNVRGIGEKSFLRIKDRLTVAPPSDGRK